MSYQQTSYRKHIAHLANDLVDPARQRINDSWFREDTADHWCHQRLYDAVRPFASEPQSRWVTIGDGRYGLDSIALRKRGFANVLATDIAEALLQKSKEQGHLERYSVENAEALSFADESFDYAFCKQSYHHFPRAPVALYEMLRVTRKAVVLVEPNDPDASVLGRLKKRAVRALGRGGKFDAQSFEPSGNYVYSVSRRELQKVALGLNLPLLAIKGLNEAYFEGAEFEPASLWSGPFRRRYLKLKLRDLACHAQLRSPDLLMALLFKVAPSAAVLESLHREKWDLVELPPNPYAEP